MVMLVIWDEWRFVLQITSDKKKKIFISTVKVFNVVFTVRAFYFVAFIVYNISNESYDVVQVIEL